MPDITEEASGQVVAFFSAPGVGIVKVLQGVLKQGDLLWVRGHTTDLKQRIGTMEIDHRPVSEVTAGQEVGIRFSARVRKNDRVYKISS